MPKNNLRLITNIIYKLKRQYGLEITLFEPLENSYDVTTGETTRSYREHTIRRAPVLPYNKMEFFTYTLAYIVAAKNFTYGANYNRERRDILVDAKDIKGYEPLITWRVLVQGKYYDIEQIKRAEDNSGYILTIVRTGADQEA